MNIADYESLRKLMDETGLTGEQVVAIVREYLRCREDQRQHDYSRRIRI